MRSRQDKECSLAEPPNAVSNPRLELTAASARLAVPPLMVAVRTAPVAPATMPAIPASAKWTGLTCSPGASPSSGLPTAAPRAAPRYRLGDKMPPRRRSRGSDT